MNATIGASIVAAVAAVIGAGLAFWNGSRVARLTAQLQREEKAKDRRIEAEKILSRFRDPLLRAAYDLQSRVYNIVAQGLLDVYLIRGTSAEADYATNNTLYVIAQYFAWNEIIRREVQFLDLGDQDRTRRLSELQDSIVHIWLTDRFAPALRVFAGDQRAIGERLVCTTSRGLDCMGYAEFVDTMTNSPQRIPQLGQLKNDLVMVAQHGKSTLPRLVALQHALIELIDFLDPESLRYPKERRTKLNAAVV